MARAERGKTVVANKKQLSVMTRHRGKQLRQKKKNAHKLNL